LESRKVELAGEIEQGAAAASAPVFHGRLSETYRARVADLRSAMQKSAPPEIREALRAMIARVDVYPAMAGQGRRIELIGHLAALLGAAGTNVASVFLSSVKRDAGTRKHLDLLLTA